MLSGFNWLKFSRLFFISLALLSSPLSFADDIMYTYCQVDSDNPYLEKGTLLMLSFNLSTSVEGLYIKQGDRFDWYAGRRLVQDGSFETERGLKDLNLALDYRAALEGYKYSFLHKASTDANTYELEDIEDCDIEFNYISRFESGL